LPCEPYFHWLRRLPSGEENTVSLRTYFFCGALAMVALAQQPAADTRPNFSGTWKLNEALRGTTPAGAHDIVFNIQHKDPSFSYSASGKRGLAPFSEAYDFVIDGRMPSDTSKLAVSAQWEGPALAMRYLKGGKEIAKVVLRLSADGRQMTRETEFPNRPRIREIYDRQ